MLKFQWRPIKTGFLFWSAIFYRFWKSIIEGFFFYMGWRLAKTTNLWDSMVASFIWNFTVATVVYYVYHYVFLRMFKMGKEK